MTSFQTPKTGKKIKNENEGIFLEDHDKALIKKLYRVHIKHKLRKYKQASLSVNEKEGLIKKGGVKIYSVFYI